MFSSAFVRVSEWRRQQTMQIDRLTQSIYLYFPSIAFAVRLSKVKPSTLPNPAPDDPLALVTLPRSTSSGRISSWRSTSDSVGTQGAGAFWCNNCNQSISLKNGCSSSERGMPQASQTIIEAGLRIVQRVQLQCCASSEPRRCIAKEVVRQNKR